MTPRDWGLLALVTIAGAALRSVAIGQEALWADEALTYVLAQASPSALGQAPIDPTAPLYYWLHQWLIPDGAGAIVGRSIALVAGVLTIPIVYFLGRGLAGRNGALFAAAWVAVSGPLVDYSQEARAYAVLVALIMLSALALHAVLRGPERWRSWALAGFVLSLILSLYTHLVALFWAGPALLILIVGSDEGRRQRWLAIAVIVVAAMPEMRRVVRYATENNAFHWLKQPDLAGFAELVATQWLPIGGVVASSIAAAALVLLAIWQRRVLRTWAARDLAGALIVAALLLQPLALWLFGFQVAPVIMERTILPSLPAVGLFVAVLIAPLGGRVRLLGGGAILAAMLGATLIGGPVRPKEEWKAARAVLRSADPERDLIVACPFWKVPALMAATRGMRSAPLVTPFLDHMRLIERRMGAEPRWERLFYERVFLTLNARPLGITPPAETETVVPVRSLFLVTSECSAEERQAIAGWADGFVVEQRWIAEPRPGHAGIAVERWALDRPRFVRLTVAR